ncbi:uncharacterized protein LOC111677476 [Lucilia cuprina]|uniref:uncharacterized protein LOC111677476 n=1 Tax=Lucilia cuprina TaxID=7375 RepID=UPI001F05EB61|nr:uncharacterized protein LOC111677476 [Lucilia cuprina]
MVVRRLDASSHEAWELCRSSSKKPATFSELEIFLSGRIQALESVESRGGLTKVPKKSAAHTHVSTSAYQKRPVEVPNKLPLQTNNYSCSLCSSNHYISSCDIYNVQVFQCRVDHNLDELLQRFWTQEEGKTKSSILSPEEKECEAHFQATYRRDSSGRYIVRLPFKSSPNTLGDSRKEAERMLAKLYQKSESNPQFFKLYSDFLKEYESLGHMVPSSQATIPTTEYFLPHHGVLRESSTTTKLRVVFNGSCKTSSGLSLNDILHTGPKLQLEISDVITRWRQYRYVFSADIEKMFRQVMVDSRDWAYQQILWTSSQSSSVVPYHLTTVTYGLGPAPYLSNRVLKQLATDEGSIYPLAVDILNNITYVDDTFGGADSIEEAQSAVIQLDKLCMAGGFHLQKWTANNSNVLSTITPERCAIKQVIQLQETQYISTLGICWQPEEDCFVFSSPFSSTSSSTPTKRSILSNISRFFDPLGWISPVTIQAKILMQDIWLSKSDWDEVVNEDLAARWSKIHQRFK